MEYNFVLLDSSHSNRRRRRRKITICRHCSSRRVKCDRSKPQCSRCASLGISCVYAFDDGERDSSTQTVTRPHDLAPNPSPELGILSVNSKKEETRYANAAHWASLLQEETVSEKNLWEEDRVRLDKGADEDYTAQLFRLATLYLPSRSVCDELGRVYFKYFNAVYPVFTSQDYYQKFDKLWARLQSTNSSDSSKSDDIDSHLCVVFAILSAASETLSQIEKFTPGEPTSHDMNLRTADINKYLTGTQEALAFFEFPAKPTFPCLSAAILIEALKLPSSGVAGTASITFLMRIAQSMGLHRDASLFKAAKFSEEQAETRRSLWWYLLYLDSYASLGNGMPSSLVSDGHDCRLPSETGKQYQGLCQIFANGAYSFCRIVCNLTSELYDPTPMQAKLDGIMQILVDTQDLLHSRRKQISSIKFLTDEDGDNFDHVRKLQHMFTVGLQLLAEKSNLILYHAVSTRGGLPMPQSNKHNPISRSKVIKSAVNLLLLYASLAFLEGYAFYNWVASLHHQFHAIAIVLRDIHDSPTKPSYLDDSEEIGETDERVEAVEKGLAASLFYHVDEKFLTRKQWLSILRFKEAAWKVKFPQSEIHTEKVDTQPVQPGMEPLAIDWTQDYGDEYSLERLLGTDDLTVDWSLYSFGI